MRVAFLDTSCLVAIAFGEPGVEALTRRLEEYDELIAANLLEAEFRSALRREGVEDDGGILDGLAWILPDRPLSPEIHRVSSVRYVRGSDLWHLAAALFLADDPGEVDFLTLDGDQREAAAALGFITPL